MDHVTSDDGTPIAYDEAGSGPALILVGGGLDDGSENAPLVPALAGSFRVYNYARRGRGESGDTSPYQVSREIEDLAALVIRAGGSAHLYGVSSGGALVLLAAAAGIPADRLAVYEVPYNLDPGWPARWHAYAEAVGAAVAEGRRGDALEAFMRVTGSPEAEIAGLRSSPYWPAMESLAHTLPYDAACLGDGRPPAHRLVRITRPTLVATGDAGHLPDAAAWVRALGPAADAIAAAIPQAERHTFAGQSHVADPEVVAPALTRFFLASG
jgi:alpha-beta hydrolase superfamily lysophospholipase